MRQDVMGLQNAKGSLTRCLYEVQDQGQGTSRVVIEWGNMDAPAVV